MLESGLTKVLLRRGHNIIAAHQVQARELPKTKQTEKRKHNSLIVITLVKDAIDLHVIHRRDVCLTGQNGNTIGHQQM